MFAESEILIARPLIQAERNSLIDVNEWLKAEEEAEANTEIREPTKPNTNPKISPMQSVTIVTGRPATSSHVGANAPTEVDLEGKNWVGLLQEYRQAHPNLRGPDYKESSPSLNRFACIVTIAESPEPLGNPAMIFSKKKDAKQYAAKLAIEWLISNKHMPADSGVTFPKPSLQPLVNTYKVQAGAPPDVAPSTSPVNDSNGVSIGQQVAQLAMSLGMSPPTYVITPHEGFASTYSGYAHFDNDPRVGGKVGEFTGVNGKKKAKQTCAREVLSFLEGIAAHRAKAVEQARRERSVTLEAGERAQSVEEVKADVKGIIRDLAGK